MLLSLACALKIGNCCVLYKYFYFSLLVNKDPFLSFSSYSDYREIYRFPLFYWSNILFYGSLSPFWLLERTELLGIL